MMYEASNGKNIEVIIIRKNNKNIYFRVKDDLKLYVSVPMYLGKDNIMKLIRKNEDAIMKMYDKMELKAKDNELFIYLGKKYYIKEDSSCVDVTFSGDTVCTPSIKALELFYDSEVRRVILEELEIAKKCFSHLPEFQVKYRNMLTRWGVCNPSKGVVTFNTELLKKDISLIDYVIIHELCHFFEGNHSKNFWALVEKAYPNYKEARRALKE